ncbi:MAG: glycosyltransferase family 2 protein [Polyangiaceae bacterium]|nr:glycosyltransferase family 2 protein [Polyangiaceae bacterium]
MSTRPELSVVVPLLNEEGNVEELAARLTAVLEPLVGSFEIVFVDDGSVDGTPLVLRALATRDRRVRVLRFARNFGQEAAVQAGMLRARGEWILQTDGDLQNPPEEIPKLIKKRDEGYEIVYGAREKRKDPPHRVLASRLLVWVMRRVLDIRLPDDVTTFRVIRGDIARLIAGLPEKRKFFSALAEWTGALAVSVPVAHAARQAGRTKYNLTKLINHTFDLMVGFSVRPLRLIGTAGALFALAGMGIAAFRIVQKLFGVDINAGWTSLFSAVVVIGGLQLIALSVIGEYVGRIFIQTQDRPLFRIAEELNFDPEPEPAGTAGDQEPEPE